MGVWCHLALNLLFSLFLVMVAQVNYPGGEAITKLHEILPANSSVYVHIGNLAAQTGVSRFTESNPNWRYSKEENLAPGGPEMLQFTHLLVEAKSKYSANLKPYSKTHRAIASVEGFSEIVMNYQLLPPVRIKTKPLIFILERNANVYVPILTKIDREVEEIMVVENSLENDDDDDDHDGSNDGEEVEGSTNGKDTEDVGLEGEGDTGNQEKTVIGDINVEVDGQESDYEDEDVDNREAEDLLAAETVYNPSEFRQLAEELQEKLNSAEVTDNKASDLKDIDFNKILLDNDIIKDIKLLANMPVDDMNPDIDQLKKALKNILRNFKDNVQNNGIDIESDDALET